MAEPGIYMKYIVHKSDGSECDPEACYFVLRLDTQPAARKAMRVYAEKIRGELPQLADDIEACCDELDAEHRTACNCREAQCPHTPMLPLRSAVWRYGDG